VGWIKQAKAIFEQNTSIIISKTIGDTIKVAIND